MRGLYIFLLAILTFSIAYGDEFEDEFEDIVVIEKKNKAQDKKLEIDSEIKFNTSYNYAHDKPRNPRLNDFRGLSSLDLAIDTKIKYKINKNYKIKTNIKIHNDFIYQLESDKYKIVPVGYENEINVNELYIQGKLSESIDISLGRQIVPWGKSDAIRVLDVLNNTDNRQLGLIDIKDLKLGRSMSKIDYFINNWNFSAMLLHENRFSKMPQYGSDYAKPTLTNDEDQLDDIGIALSILGNLKGQDIGFYFTRQYMDRQNYYSSLIGFSYVKVINSFLFKTDIAYLEDTDTTDIVGGLEYTGFNNKTITIEIASKGDNTHFYGGVIRDFFNKSLLWSKSIYMINDKENIILRTNLDYAINDNYSVKLGFIIYRGDSNPLKLLKDNDRAFGEIKYSF
jgi:hypothetical protein